MEVVRRELEDLEEAGVIERSTLSYYSSVIAVSKKNGRVHIFDDCHNLSAVTRLIVEPMPHTKVVFAWLSGSKFFTKHDLIKLYFQVQLEEENESVTVFSTSW